MSLINLSRLRCVPCGVPRAQPPDYTLPGMEDPNAPENEGKNDDQLRNTCAICQEPLSGPAEGDPKLPDELEIIRGTTQYHRWCLAGWVMRGNKKDLTLGVDITDDEIEEMLAFRKAYNEDPNFNPFLTLERPRPPRKSTRPSPRGSRSTTPQPTDVACAQLFQLFQLPRLPRLPSLAMLK